VTTEQPRIDPAVQGFALLTATAFTVELLLAMTLAHMPAEQAKGTAGAMLLEWRNRAAAATTAVGLDGGQTIAAAGAAVERLLASAVVRADNIRAMRAANATAAVMAAAPTTGTVN